MARTKEQHLDAATGPKRILALDGGGIRGILSLQYLGVIETMLRSRTGRQDLVLSDYFDLIGGTSTGSIIAAGLACGFTVDKLKELYTEIGASVFKRAWYRLPFLAQKFPTEPLQKALDATMGADTTLDGDRIRTGVMIMTKRLDSGSPWPLHNHPAGRYAEQDGKLRLTQVVRASTAAPTYFAPEKIAISRRDGTHVDGAFVDGGASPFNDPALQLLMLAALQGHGFRWKTGADQILLVSVGTGTFHEHPTAEELMDMVAVGGGVAALKSLMDDCAQVNQALLQWLTNCLTPWNIDRAVGDMQLDSASGPKLATYVRYNALLEHDWLQKECGITATPDSIERMARMDDPSNMNRLIEVGQKAAARQVKPEHFPAGFDA